MPTVAGMRRRGFPAAAIREFCRSIGLTKRDNLMEIERLEYYVRNELNKTSARVMGVLDPLKVVITNYPEGQVEEMEVINNPEDESMGTRTMPFSREIYIERKDFMIDPPKKFFRMGPGRNVRLKAAYILHCEHYVQDPDTGVIQEVHCTYYPDSKSGQDTSGIKAKGVLHWVSIGQAKEVEVRLYDRLFTDPQPDGYEDRDYLEFFNEDSLQVIEKAYVEPSLKEAKAGTTYQFLRMGYFAVDTDSTPDKLIFNRTVSLKDTWAKMQKKQK
jgi:glutaminyl-tRNA synthetase